MTMTTKTPILDELHAVREQMLADAGGTLAGLVAKIQSDQAKSDRVILKSADNSADNNPMHGSGEVGRFQMDNHQRDNQSPPPSGR